MKMNEVVPDLAAADDSQATGGTQGTQGTQGTVGTNQAANTAKEKNQKRQAERAKDKQIRPGQKIKLPTQDGQEQEFKVSRDMGNEVEIENPEGRNNPNEPNKLVYDKKQLRRGMSTDNENNRTR